MSDNSTGSSGFIFATTDPLGRDVVLKLSTWHEHITGGDHERKELIGEELTIQRAIENPRLIVKSEEDENRELYYDLPYLRSMHKIKTVSIVVDHSGDIGDICTIHVQSKMSGTTDEGGIVYDNHEK